MQSQEQKHKEELKTHLFYTIRKYMLKDSIWNNYDDVVLYWSYDTKQFLKRHELNKKPIGNWFIIPHNSAMMFYLKEHLNIQDKTYLRQDGRLIWNNSFQSDDLHKKFMSYIDKTFKNFYRIYNKNNQIQNEKQPTTKQLF